MRGTARIAATVVLVVGSIVGTVVLASRLADDGQGDMTSDSSTGNASNGSAGEQRAVVSGRMLVSDLGGLRELSVDLGHDGALIRGERQIESRGLAQAPSYSPDGQRFAYVLASDSTTDIMIGSIEGSDTYALTKTSSVRETGPAWSPDGKYVAYERTDDLGKTDIWLADVESGEQRRATNGNDMYLSPDWAPGSSRFAYVARSRDTGESDLFAYDVSTDATTQLTATAGLSESQPAYAPYGERLAYTVSEDSEIGLEEDAHGPLLSSIYVFGTGDKPTRLATSPDNFLFVDWLSDDTLGVVEFRSPGRILAVPLSDPTRTSDVWDGDGLASFDWRPEK